MWNNWNVKVDPPDEALFRELVIEFGEHGRTAVEFIETARTILSGYHSLGTRAGDAVAYCLREAMKSIPKSHGSVESRLRNDIGDDIIGAAKRFKAVRDLPGEDIRSAIDELLELIDESDAARREGGLRGLSLAALMENRFGELPMSAGSKPFKEYLDLVSKLDKEVHNPIATAKYVAIGLLGECMHLLWKYFSPVNIRNQELDELASRNPVTENDFIKLEQVAITRLQQENFGRRLTSADWLPFLTKSVLFAPRPSDNQWSGHIIARSLAITHEPEVVKWLGEMFGKYSGEPERIGPVIFAANDVGPAASKIVVEALRMYPSNSQVMLSASLIITKLDPTSEDVTIIADILLNINERHQSIFIREILDRFVSGVTASNASVRLNMLCHKVNKIADCGAVLRRNEIDSLDTILGPDFENETDNGVNLIRSLVQLVDASSAYLSVDELLSQINLIPQDIRHRFRARILGSIGDIESTLLVREIADAATERNPTLDDVSMLEKLKQLLSDPVVLNKLSESLGNPPTIQELGEALAHRTISKTWTRSRAWAVMIGGEIGETWRQINELLSAVFGQPSDELVRSSLRSPVVVGSSPFSAEYLKSLGVYEAAKLIAEWRPNTSDWLVSARELGRILQKVVIDEPDRWLHGSLKIIATLREPVYIAHYLSGVASVCESEVLSIEEILNAITFTRTHPWAPTILGDDDFQYDPDWRGVEQAGVEVLKKLADCDRYRDNQLDIAWKIIHEEVVSLGEKSSIVSGTDDPLERAINRSCTRSFEAAFSLMGSEYRQSKFVRSKVFELLEWAVSLEGQDGAEFRAIIAPRLGFIRFVAPDWVDNNRIRIFGSFGLADLGRLTLDQALKWGQPNHWLLEHYVVEINDAICRGIDRALEHVVIGMLWAVPGYAVEEVISRLKSDSAQLSRAGELLGRILRKGETNKDYLDLAMEFWRSAITTKDPDGLLGFGWFSEVSQLDDQEWLKATLGSLRVSNGRIDWAHNVAERLLAMKVSPSVLDAINLLVRGAPAGWDRPQIMEVAVKILTNARTEFSSTDVFSRLNTSLQERGVI